MKKFFLLLAVLFGTLSLSAQVENRALSLQKTGSVDCGILPELNGLRSFAVQLWLRPSSWTQGATLLQRGNLSLSLGTSGSVVVRVGDFEATFSSSDLKAGTWSQLTVLNYKGKVTALVNGTQVGMQKGAEELDFDTPLTLGGGYAGALDEVRIWNSAMDEIAYYKYFWNNTLNEFNDWLPNLVVYYKMDHEEWTASLADYRSIWKRSATNHHGTITNGTFIKANNDRLPYLLNGAYTNNERFYDRGVPREAYLLSNDIINLAIDSWNTGALDYSMPAYHGALAGTATVEDYFQTRSGVLSLDGSGTFVAPAEAFEVSGAYAFGGWIYISEWVEGAYIMQKGDGISLRLGEESLRQLIVSIDGQEWIYQPAAHVLVKNKWIFVGFSANGEGSFRFVVNSSEQTAKQTGTETTPSQHWGSQLVFGKGFKGAMDHMFGMKCSLSSSDLYKYATNPIMPGVGEVISSWYMQYGNFLYKFDKADEPGYDSWSQDEWLAIMTKAYDGYRGYQMRISVKSHDNWEQTLWSQEKRLRFASDLARLSKPFAGVELDLEWCYSSQWATFGDFIDEIRAALPEDKTFMVSCHNVAYTFVPQSKYGVCDGFTMQQYGPQKTHFYWSTFQDYTQRFLNYGFPREKVYVSYSTTTSREYDSNESLVAPIRGVRGGALDQEGYEPSQDCDVWNCENGNHVYFVSPYQVYRRAQYATDNQLQGIFYWDMGNDLAPTHKYMYAKMASYGLNANVDRIVTDATPKAPAATGTSAPDPDQSIEDPFEAGTRILQATADKYLVDGAYIGILSSQSDFEGCTWWAGDVNATAPAAEVPVTACVYQLESAPAGGFYLRHVESGKYVGHDTSISSRGNFYDVVMCASKTDSRIARITFPWVTGTGSHWQNDVNNLAQIYDNNAAAYPYLKPQNGEYSDWGLGGTDGWKTWRLYAFTPEEADVLTGIVQTRLGGDAVHTSATGVYDLSGRRVLRATKGVYIVDGRKIIR